MSKKGGGGGSVSGRGGGTSRTTPTPRNIPGGPNGGRYSHFKTLETDAKYGMLMWQSKLQEKLVKEQKEKKQKELSTLRRRSDEDYAQQGQFTTIAPTRAQTRFGTVPLRVSSNTSRTITTLHARNNSNTDPDPSVSHSKVNFEHESDNGKEVRIQISREGPPAPYQHRESRNNPGTPTQMADLDLSEKFATFENPNKYLGDNSHERYQFHGRVLENDGEQQYNYDEDANAGRLSQAQNSAQNQYSHASNKPNAISTPILPKIGKLAGGGMQMPKLNNSVSHDNLSKPSLLPNHYHHTYSQLQQDMQTSLPAAGRATPYNFSTNLAFFGLQGFGDGGAGGAGAGAPRRSPSGRLLTNLQGHPEIRYHQKDTRGFDQTLRYMMDKDRIHQYKEDLDKQVLENNAQRARVGRGSLSIPIKIMSSHESNEIPGGFGENGRKSTMAQRGPGMELAPLIRKYKSLPKLNTHKSSSDVTKQYVVSPRRGDYCLSPEPEEVAKGLLNQLVEKQRIHNITQENDRLASEKHFNTWDSWWGRPGCGAPMVYYKNSRIGASTPSLATSRTDLFKALHMTHQRNKPN